MAETMITNDLWHSQSLAGERSPPRRSRLAATVAARRRVPASLARGGGPGRSPPSVQPRPLRGAAGSSGAGGHRTPASRHAALVVLGRAGARALPADGRPGRPDARARRRFEDVDASRLDARDRLELLIGLGEALYLDDLFLPAAELLESAMGEAPLLGRRRARSVARLVGDGARSPRAVPRRRPSAVAIYRPHPGAHGAEIERIPGTGAAAYWMAVAARARGDIDRAWDLARAGWVRAQLTRDRGAALAPDLDRLVREAIIPGARPPPSRAPAATSRRRRPA